MSSPLLTEESRRVFLGALGALDVDDATLARSRGAAIRQACAAPPVLPGHIPADRRAIVAQAGGTWRRATSHFVASSMPNGAAVEDEPDPTSAAQNSELNGLVPIERWPNEDEMVADLYGGAWADPDSWAARCRPDACMVCTSGHPYGILAEFAHSWVTTDPEVALFGYVCVISKTHAVEPFDLPDDAQSAFWFEAMAVAEVLSDALRPVKMNYEIHGNTLPHLHMHLLPRQPDDAFIGRPVDLREFHHRYSDDELSMLKAVVASAAADRNFAPAGCPRSRRGQQADEIGRIDSESAAAEATRAWRSCRGGMDR